MTRMDADSDEGELCIDEGSGDQDLQYPVLHLPGGKQCHLSPVLHLPGGKQRPLTPVLNIPGGKRRLLTPVLNIPGGKRSPLTPCARDMVRPHSQPLPLHPRERTEVPELIKALVMPSESLGTLGLFQARNRLKADTHRSSVDTYRPSVDTYRPSVDTYRPSVDSLSLGSPEMARLLGGMEQDQDTPLDLRVSKLRVRADLMEASEEQALDLSVLSQPSSALDLRLTHRSERSPSPCCPLRHQTIVSLLQSNNSTVRSTTRSPLGGGSYSPAIMGLPQSISENFNQRMMSNFSPDQYRSLLPGSTVQTQKRPRSPDAVSLLRIKAHNENIHQRAVVHPPRTPMPGVLQAGKRSVSPTEGAAPPSIWNITVKDLEAMLEPYLARVERKVVCTICSIRFPTKDKAFSHIENKHIDCFQYKCPQCRTTKVSRLAFDCHTRSRHSASRKALMPLLRLKREFAVKEDKSRPRNRLGDKSTLKEERKKGSYDLLFVTFLRDELSTGLPALESPTNLQSKPGYPSSLTSSPSPSPTYSSPSPPFSREGSLSPGSSPHEASYITSGTPTEDAYLTSSGDYLSSGQLASWVNKEQGIFRINKRKSFANKWFQTKGIVGGTWERLERDVLSSFQARSLIKVISSSPSIFQIFCIRQLLQ